MCEEGESSKECRTWLGTSFDDMYNGLGPWNFSVPPIIPSKYHHILYELPVNAGNQPKPHHNTHPKHWNDDHVRMPYSEKSLFVIKENGEEVVKPRWDVIREALTKPIKSSLHFEAAVNSYNTNLPEFTALHYFFTEILEEEETRYFFNEILPGIINLALQLPELLPGSIPLLKKNHCKSISLSQMQIACLLANAFLCTFIWRRDLAPSYPVINFVRLFTANERENQRNCVGEKLKCIYHYFKKIKRRNPTGVVTFERKFIPRNQMPRWDSIDNNLGKTNVHITSTGIIEDARGLLQVDFANKFVGGGVLGYGCVQEEIRFVIYPELIISRLFTEELSDNEALIVIGAERYSSHSGYGDTFKWESNYDDDTPYDDYLRKRTSLSVIDAIRFNKPKDQFNPSAIIRELNKAFVGFSSREKSNLSPVASGNWGCGAFKGNPYLKCLIQLMACTASNRHLVYYSFGNEELRDDFYNMYLFLSRNNITICQLWRFFCKFCSSNLPPEQLYSFIQQSHFDSKTQPTLKSFCVKIKDKVDDKPPEIPPNNNEEIRDDSHDVFEDAVVDLEATTSSSSSQSYHQSKTNQSSPDDLISVIDLIDGDRNRNVMDIDEPSSTFLSELDSLRKLPRERHEDETMDLDDDSNRIATFLEDKRRKITDYFTKIAKSS